LRQPSAPAARTKLAAVITNVRDPTPNVERRDVCRVQARADMERDPA
jgi:hypothetical protein